MVRGDTIAAIATPRGEGALSIVRISGPESVRIADACFRGRIRPSKMASHTVAYGRVVSVDGRVLDRVLLTVMRGPRTSTGEDTVEISGHGGCLPAPRILDRILEAGARLAEPGEFTRRAFLNGRMDLVQAEAVLEIVRARTEEGLDAALRQVDGEASRQFQVLRERLDECRAQLECAIDFAEDAAPWSDVEIRRRLEGIRVQLDELIERARVGRQLQDGALVAIVGRPNVGKSTLFNALLGRERVIVSETPGTTRDVVVEWTAFGGIPVRLADTAGLRASSCTLERAAVERAQRERSVADVVVLVLDGSEPPTVEDRDALTECDPGRTLVVLNKVDLTPSRDAEKLVENLDRKGPVVRLSALRGQGLGDLKSGIAERVTRSVDPEVGVAASLRQVDVLRRTREAVGRSIEIMRESRGIELAAADLREAVEAFGEMAGTTGAEEILDRIFREFCIGK